MKKRIIALIVALVLVGVGSGSYLATTVANLLDTKKQEEHLKTEYEKGIINNLFHDQGHIYMTPDEPKEGETVTIRLRTARYNATRAQIQYTIDKGSSWKVVDMEFEKQDDTGYYDIWKGELKAEGDLMYYRFIVGNTDLLNTVYYNTKGIALEEGSYTDCWQIVPGHDVPDWAKGALIYSIMPDAFYNGNTTNDKRISGDNTYTTWNSVHTLSGDRYGGDLAGIERKLDYISALNVDTIYMNPIQKSWHNAGYAPIRYEEVESAFGNEEDLKSLSDAVHNRDMKLLGDVVLTFADEDSYYFNQNGRWPVTGTYQSEKSEWASMFKIFHWPDNYMKTWDSPAIDLNQKMAKDLLYAKQDSYLIDYARYFDGYRFDCGGWLWGTTQTDDLTAYTFVKEIRDSLKAEKEDFYLLSEADWGNLNNKTWDAQWNINYMPKLQDYAGGLINETLMVEAMRDYEMTLPRNVALCMTNMLSDHDSNRIVQHDAHMYNAALLIQMTYLGSPSIFYGEEVDLIRENEEGIGTTQPFYAMEWDESNWNQSRLQFYKATTELRKEYSCVKTGVVKMLDSDIATNMISYGRWDENGAAITVTSQNSDILTVEIPVHECDITNGTVMTDWYTGKQYVVEDGMITADIIPGGTVIVTGNKSSDYRGGYGVTTIGDVDENNAVTTINTVSYKMNGRGNLDGTTDDITFAGATTYDDFSVFANVSGEDKGTLLIRNSVDKDSVYYAAVVDDDTLSIMARTEEGKEAKTLVETECTSNTYVKIERTAENMFMAYRTEVTDGNLGQWEPIEKATVSIAMDKEVCYGFAPLKGEMRVNNITYAAGGKASTFDTFDGEKASALFDNVNANFVTVADGRLTIQNSKEHNLHYLITNSMDADWTFKTKMNASLTDGEYAGLVSRQDENTYVVAGRTKIRGKQKLFIGKGTGGAVAIYDTVNDPIPDEDIILQLQRVGAYYSAVYSADEGKTWHYIGKMYTNFSNESVGILVAGEGSATYDWVSFGDSINDGTSTNTPYAPTTIDTTYTNNSTEEEAKYEWVSGDWALIDGGWAQKAKEGYAQASATNKIFSGLYAEATVEVTEGAGYAGLAFGKETPYTDEKDGFILKYYKDGKLELVDQNETITARQLEVPEEGGMRLVVEATEGHIVIYAGQDITPVVSLEDTGYYNGYVSFCTEDAKAEFRNFHHGSTNASWNWTSRTDNAAWNWSEPSGAGGGNAVLGFYSTWDQRELHSIATLAGYGFTDFVVTTKCSMVQANTKLASAAGVLVAASEGKSAVTEGVYVHLNEKKQLVLSVDGVQQSVYKMPKATASAYIMIVKQGGTYKVFLKGKDKAVLEYKEEINRGGAISLYTINGDGFYTNVEVENLQPNQKYEESKLAKAFVEAKTVSKPFAEDFGDKKAEENFYRYYDEYGTFDVKDGVLRCKDSSNWLATATLLEDSYSDFTMQFKLRIDVEGTGWMSVGLRRDKANGNHNNSGVAFMVQPDGNAFFFGSKEQQNASAHKISNFEVGKWYDVKIVAKGSAITAYINGKKVSSFTDTKYKEGFISFATGMTDYSIDDLKITPMK